MISTSDLSNLPEVEPLRKLCQSLAMLDAIFLPTWEDRYFSFNARWSENEMMASMRNGEGDHLFVLFTPSGAIGKGFAHESLMSPYRKQPPLVWAGVLEGVPSEFWEFLSEPACSPKETTFCFWRTLSDANWRRGNIAFHDGNDPDGSRELLRLFDNEPRSYCKWAEEMHERAVDLVAVSQIYAHQPLSQAIISALNPSLFLRDANLEEDAQEIGYPALRRTS